jgi:type IV pilus assembly protein PilY1
MDNFSLRAAWAGAGLLIALTSGSPVLADDTELLTAAPGAVGDKPNILFILDSSGSMTTIEQTQEPYNSSKSYAGSCDADQYYWTTGAVIPDCDSSGDFLFPKTSFVCQQGVIQAGASGSYKDTMAQYRAADAKWERPLEGDDGIVECWADSGAHGDGSAGGVYAQIGTNLPPFTSDPDKEVAWGNGPTDRIVTVYDGNYLNWYYNAPITEMSRNEIVKEVTKNVLGSIGGVNVGFMQFHEEQGGPVVHAVKDLDANRSEAVAVVNSLPADGYTPLSETMYEAALYWRGMAAQFAQFGATDQDALSSLNPMVYDNPADFACARNFNIFLTDGEPTRDVDAYDLAPALPGFAAELGRATCTGNADEDGACLDDIAEYLSKVDINTNVEGEQTVATYTIGFTVDLDILKTTAENSGGEYYLAEDTSSLTAAITEIVTKIFNRSVSFAAPAVAVNAFNRTQHLNDLYLSVFRPSETFHWPGNIKKYTMDSGVVKDSVGRNAVNPNTGFFADNALSYWSTTGVPDGANVTLGGAANRLPDPGARKLYTNKTGANLTAPGNQVSIANLGSFSPAEFGLIGAAGEPELADLIQWARGVDVKDYDGDPSTTVRYHTATNDGYLHAINARTGQEIWSFIPHELLPNLIDLYNDEAINFKNYGIDGDLVPVVADRDGDGEINPGTDFAYLIFGMRRGGKSYYALDVTNRNMPKIMWVRSFPQFGQTWSPASVTRVDVSGGGASSPDNAVVVIGGGYDTTHDQPAFSDNPDAEGAAVFMLDLQTGVEVWRAGADADADLTVPMMKRAFPSRIRVLDMSGDGYADRMYAADVGGQIWRFDIANGETPGSLVTGGVIAQLGAEGSVNPGPGDTRRMYNTPDVAMFYDELHDRRYLSISVGSGYRAHPLDTSATDRFYSVRDPNIFSPLTQGDYNIYPIVKDSDLVEVSGKLETVLEPGDAGWKFTLPANEMILAESTTFDDAVYFVSFEPQGASSDPCQAGLSVNRLYRVNVKNGDPVVNTEGLDPGDSDNARRSGLEQGGIAPKPTFLFPSPDDDCEGQECSPPPIGCIGLECFDPGFVNAPVRTLWSQDGIE